MGRVKCWKLQRRAVKRSIAAVSSRAPRRHYACRDPIAERNSMAVHGYLDERYARAKEEAKAAVMQVLAVKSLLAQPA